MQSFSLQNGQEHLVDRWSNEFATVWMTEQRISNPKWERTNSEETAATAAKSRQNKKKSPN